MKDKVQSIDFFSQNIKERDYLLSAEIEAHNEQERAFGYKRKRANEYPAWQDQLDNIYHNGLDAWKASIKTIKDKYSKP